MGEGEPGFTGIDAIGDQLPGTTGPRACTLYGVIKQNSAANPHAVGNEFICGRLGLLAGLPVPPGVIVPLDDEGIAYVGVRFGLKGETPPPAFEDLLAQNHPELALRIVVFDSWIANNDRHATNLAYSPGRVPLRVFDHERALLGAGGIKRLEEVQDKPILNECLVEYLNDNNGLGKIIDEIRWVSSNRAAAVCDEALESKAINREERQRIVDFLSRRAGSLERLVAALPIRGQMLIQTGTP
jgi:HipA-like kinase